MALKVKSASAAATKYAENAGRAAESYATEAMAAGDRWAAGAGLASTAFKQAIQAPGIEDRFRRGVAKAGSAKYSAKIAAVGKDRFAPGVAAGAADFQQNVEPYLQTISGLTLAQRKPRGDPGNLKRVEQVNTALHQKRLALLGTSS